MITSDPLLATDQPRLLSRPHMEPIGSPSRPAKVQPWHLERLAVVYVRQIVGCVKSAQTHRLCGRRAGKDVAGEWCVIEDSTHPTRLPCSTRE